MSRNEKKHAWNIQELAGTCMRHAWINRTMYETCGNKQEHALNKQELTGICMRCIDNFICRVQNLTQIHSGKYAFNYCSFTVLWYLRTLVATFFLSRGSPSPFLIHFNWNLWFQKGDLSRIRTGDRVKASLASQPIGQGASLTSWRCKSLLILNDQVSDLKCANRPARWLELKASWLISSILWKATTQRRIVRLTWFFAW